MRYFRLTYFCLLLAPRIAGAHEGHDHYIAHPAVTNEQSAELKRKYEQINERYLQVVRPIFERACVACHSENAPLPWYHAIPVVRGVIDRDVSEAQKHLDFTPGFPFRSHASPEEDLTAIAKSISEGSMPPKRYRILHPGARLSVEDVKTIMAWASEGLANQLRRP